MPKTKHKTQPKPMAFSPSGLWMMAEDRIKTAVGRAASAIQLSLSGQRAAVTAEYGNTPAQYSTLSSGVAVIPVVGVLTKYPMPEDWMDEYCGFCPTMPIISALDRAMEDQFVRAVVLELDCPGGLVAGTNLLAEAIAAYKLSHPDKPIYAVVSDLAASGGYYLASQCQKITCNAMGEVGSIGVYCLLTDESKFWAGMGVSFTIVSSGGVKGLGADGTISQELIDEEKRGVMAIYEKFIADVAGGRGMKVEQARQLGDGRVWQAPEAKQLGLIDDVANVATAMAAISQETSKMTEEAIRAFAAANPDAACIKELKQSGHVAGVKAGKAEGVTEERARVGAIFEAHGLKDHAAFVSVNAGHDVETAKVIADTATKARAAVQAETESHKAEVVRLNKELEKAKFEASGQRAIGTAVGAAREQQPQPTTGTDPASVAKAAWAEMSADDQSAWLNEDAFVKFSIADAKGQIKASKVSAA